MAAAIIRMAIKSQFIRFSIISSQRDTPKKACDNSGFKLSNEQSGTAAIFGFIKIAESFEIVVVVVAAKILSFNENVICC